MKRIVINTKDGPIELIDDNDEQTKEEIVKSLSEMMQGSTLVLVKTSHTSALIRPSYISGIVVEEHIGDPTKEDASKEYPEINNQELEQNIETIEGDVVTDMEQ